MWREPGPCPFCGVVTEHTWFSRISGQYQDPVQGSAVTKLLGGREGSPLMSQCASVACRNLAFWLSSGSDYRLVYPQRGVRIPPKEGLTTEEEDLYKEAAAVAPVSRRAASALLRVLLEAFLKRHLTAAGHSAKKTTLARIIDLAVEHLDLSNSLKKGLTAIRMRGNDDVHDPYSLTDMERVEYLPWLFEAVDQLVDDLEIKPKIWATIAKT